jgi:2-hydroxychromene-2-carboxylate isomerase
VRSATWYFDFVSPYAYLCFGRLRELPADVAIELRPVLFAGLLAHWGQKGPAEIDSKRRWTYRACQYWADAHTVPFRFPQGHPFNPLHHLRLAIAAGCTPAVVGRIFAALWTTGADPADARAFASLCGELGVDQAMIGATEVKDRLRRNTEQAAALGVFGVPTFAVDGELFWGNDSIEFLNAFLIDPAMLRTGEMKRLDTLPVSAARKS